MYIVEEFGEVMDISAKQVKAACLAAIAGGALLGTVGAPWSYGYNFYVQINGWRI